MKPAVRQALLALYEPLPRSVRLFVRIRLSLSDLDQIERYVPTRGAMLDIGCGHGLVANLLAITGPERTVLGIDLDEHKIASAQQTVGHRANIRFAVGDAGALPPGRYTAVTIADVMYLIPPATQRAIITSIAQSLEPGGLLVWKSQVRHPRWKYALTYGQEWLMTTVGPTRGAGLYFMDQAASLAAIGAAGLRPAAVAMPSLRPYTDMLFLGYKPEA